MQNINFTFHVVTFQPQQRYDKDQRRYFDTEPKDRKTLVRELKQKFLQNLETKKISKDSSEPSW